MSDWAGDFWGIRVMSASVRLLSSVLFALALLAFPLAASHGQAEQRLLCVHGIEAPDVLTVRSGPNASAPIVGSYPPKVCGVQLVGRCADGWCEMSLSGVTGWVNTRHIAVYEVPDAPRAGVITRIDPPKGQPTAPTARATPPVEQGSSEGDGQCVARVGRGDTLRIRSGPGASHDEIAGIPPGACNVVRAGGCRGDWCQVTWRGRTGWVNAYYLD